MITGRYLRTDYPVLIHLCKDRTLSYRRVDLNEPIFNGVAVPVLSVRSEQEAEDLLMLVGTRQYEPHPNKNYRHGVWIKLFNGVAGWKPYLDPPDVPEAEDYLYNSYQRILATHAAA